MAIYAGVLPYWYESPDEYSASPAESFDLGQPQADAPARDRERLTDDELGARVRDGDVRAFEVLFARYAAALAAFAFRFTRAVDDSQDIVQDVFIRVWVTRGQFSVRGTVRGYLYAAVRNRALHMVEHANVEARAADAFLGTGIYPTLGAGSIRDSESADAAILNAEVAGQVRAAVSTLPPRSRLIAMMRWQDGLSRGDIAEALGISVGTVNKQLTLAARALRARLSEEDR